MVVDGGLQDDQFLPRDSIGIRLLGVGTAELSINVIQEILAEEFVKALDPPLSLRWISVLRHYIIKVEMENVSDGNVLCLARSRPCCRCVLLAYIRCERLVGSIKVISLDASAELATSIKDDPGGSMGDLPGFVAALWSFPQSGWTCSTRDCSGNLTM